MKTKEAKRAYQRAWVAKRRAEWIAANGPCRHCGCWEDIQVDHIDPATKVSHMVWSWSKARREAELAKCQALCRECHQWKTAGENSKAAPHGTHTRQSKGCRCDLCREAQRLYSLARKRKLGASPRNPRDPSMRGITKVCRRWKVHLTRGGIRKYVGCFRTIQEAQEAVRHVDTLSMDEWTGRPA